MQRATSVSELTRNPVDGSYTEGIGEEKRNPPGVPSGGLQCVNRAGAGDAPGVDFASALLTVIQARYRVGEVMRAEARIIARRRADQSDIAADERGEHLAVYREGFEVYRGTWPEPVRRHFAALMGESYDAFADALQVLAEALYEGAARPGPMGAMITPEVFGDE